MIFGTERSSLLSSLLRKITSIKRISMRIGKIRKMRNLNKIF
jgi:hypothetical protein